MTPRSMSDPLIRDTPLISAGATVQRAVRALLETDLPALPVVGDDERLCGIFGEREFLSALFPGYVSELRSASFVPRSMESVLEKRASCRNEQVREHMNTEHIAVEGDYSDTQVAETFLHHRVLILPVVDDGRVQGVITRGDFFRALADRFLST